MRRRLIRKRHTALPVALLCALAGLAGCRPGTPDTAASAPLGPSSPTGPAGNAGVGTQSPTPAGTPGTTGCRKAELAVTTAGQSGGSGHRGVVLVFTNSGTRSCQLRGYPGVAALDAAGAQVAQARRTSAGYLGGLASGAQIPAVTLSAGQSASAMVEALAFNAADGSACTAYRGLLVTAPDDVESTRLPWDTDGCSDLQVHPVVPGTTGRAG